jgi:hypothetical protein
MYVSFTKLTLIVAALTSLPLVSFGQSLTPVRPVPGLKCMSLDPSSRAATRQDALPPILASPDPNAPRIGYPTSVVFVKTPVHEQNGFIEVVRLNGQGGWIAADHLRPWRPLNGESATCTPSVMSNGKLGTSIH